MIVQRSAGRIINISSVHEAMPMPGNTPYCLSKGGLRMLTCTAGIELAPYGILVIGVGPGGVATPTAHDIQHDPQLLAKLNRSIPLDHVGQPEEIATLVGFLAGPAGAFLSATTVFADGGLMHNGLGIVGTVGPAAYWSGNGGWWLARSKTGAHGGEPHQRMLVQLRVAPHRCGGVRPVQISAAPMLWHDMSSTPMITSDKEASCVTEGCSCSSASAWRWF